jgi:hypothetical protein
MPASYANRESGPSIPNSDADAMTMTKPRTGIAPPAEPIAGLAVAGLPVTVLPGTGGSDVTDGLDTGEW